METRGAARLLLLLLGAVLQLEGVVVAPGVAQVGVEGDGAVAPGARLLLLAIPPEEARDLPRSARAQGEIGGGEAGGSGSV